MTPLQQRGIDDYKAGKLDPVLMKDDGPNGRLYRDGTREARRDAFDASLGLAPVVPAPVEIPPPAPAPLPYRIDERIVEAVAQDPIPAPKAKKPKAPKIEQAELF